MKRLPRQGRYLMRGSAQTRTRSRVAPCPWRRPDCVSPYGQCRPVILRLGPPQNYLHQLLLRCLYHPQWQSLRTCPSHRLPDAKGRLRTPHIQPSFTSGCRNLADRAELIVRMTLLYCLHQGAGDLNRYGRELRRRMVTLAHCQDPKSLIEPMDFSKWTPRSPAWLSLAPGYTRHAEFCTPRWRVCQYA
jgi:hypothetical protein